MCPMTKEPDEIELMKYAEAAAFALRGCKNTLLIELIFELLTVVLVPVVSVAVPKLSNWDTTLFSTAATCRLSA
jgi:hypothetical protein